MPWFVFGQATAGATGDAVIAAKILRTDSLEVKIDKILRLLNEERFFNPKQELPKNPLPFDVPYHLDSMRSSDEILGQKIGGSCGSSARAFAGMLVKSGLSESDVQVVESVVNQDLRVICPKAGLPRASHPQVGARGHSFVAVRFAKNDWRLINPIDSDRQRSNW